MTQEEKRKDFEKCIQILNSRACYCLALRDEAGAKRAREAAKRFSVQMAELNSVPSEKEVRTT